MTVLVLFPGKTDETTYSQITARLDLAGIKYNLRLASAHKSPNLVDEILKDDYDFIITGAGLAAALPGVVAAKKTCPVLGVPCPGAYEMLDSFLSIVQMPPGVPVLAVTARNASGEAAKIATVMKNKSMKVAVVGEGKAVDKAKETLTEMGIAFEMGDIIKDGVNIVFTQLGEEVPQMEELIIYCPTGDSTAEDAAKALEAAKEGLWVGVNRGENAAIAVAEILGKKNALNESRRKFEEKVRQQDAEVKK